MAYQSAIMQIKATNGDLSPKKKIDQKKFKASWTRKRFKDSRTPFFLSPFCQIKKAEMPIIKYKIVQTGANIQFGGEKNGLFKMAYQSDMDEAVNKLPVIPTNSQPMMQKTSFPKSLIFPV